MQRPYVKTKAEPQYEITYVCTNNQKHTFKSTKVMLESHKMLLKGNSCIKQFSVKPLF